MRLEVTAPRPDKCQLGITQAVTHPLSKKAEPCLTRAISYMTPYHYAASQVNLRFKANLSLSIQDCAQFQRRKVQHLICGDDQSTQTLHGLDF